MCEDLSTDRWEISHGNILHIGPSNCLLYRQTVFPPPVEKAPFDILSETYPQVVYFKALSLLLLHSHHTSLKRRSSAILHSSESLPIGSLMARRWLTFRLTSLLMNSSSHHHCVSSPAKACVVQARFRDDEGEDCLL